ncbi:MAG TPA: GNAT family N-acetyltransferase [Solirubrobacterales bacterium]|nr:GNAT family N-acetyltransferase [Solirubrobacterales bacterium]
MSLAIEWIEDRAAFDGLAGEWEALLPEDSHPFDLHCWYAAWWDAFGAAAAPAVCTARRGGELVGAFPLRRSGSRLGALANSHSAGLFRPLAADGEALEALVAAAASDRAPTIELEHLPQDGETLPLLEAGMREASRMLLPDGGFTSPIVETDGDFDAWRAQSKPRWGAPLERFRRKMGRDHEAELAIVVEPGDLEAELAAGFEVEASGWKGEAGTAILSTPETEAFYRQIARSFHERGELRLSRIVLDGELAAFDFCFLHRGRLYLQKTGFDERFRRLAPGLVLRLATVERCFELDLAAHELLGDASEWKLKFANAERRRVVLRAYRRSPRGATRYAYRRALRPPLRSAYRRLRPRGR